MTEVDIHPAIQAVRRMGSARVIACLARLVNDLELTESLVKSISASEVNIA